MDNASISGFVRNREGQAIKNSGVCAATVSSEVFWIPDVTCTATDSGGPAARFRARRFACCVKHFPTTQSSPLGGLTGASLSGSPRSAVDDNSRSGQWARSIESQYG
jgi:hypothetical protein